MFTKHDDVLELGRAYIPLLLVEPKRADASGSSKGLASGKELHWTEKRVFGEAYKQTNPIRRGMIVVEDGPQGLLVTMVAVASGGINTFTFVVNIGIPTLRFLFAWIFHDEIAWRARRWLLLEATRAFRTGLNDQGRQYTWPLLQTLAKNQQRPGNDTAQAFADLRSLKEDHLLRRCLRLLPGSRGLAQTETTLDFSRLDIGDKGAVAIAEGLKVNHRLTTINISKNNIGEKGAAAIAEGLKLNQGLTTIDISLNNIGEKGEETISGQLQRNRAAFVSAEPSAEQ